MFDKIELNNGFNNPDLNKHFDDCFNVYLIESDDMLLMYETFLFNIKNKCNRITNNPMILTHIKDDRYYDQCIEKNYVNFKYLTDEYKEFILNVIKFNSYENVKKSGILKAYKLGYLYSLSYKSSYVNTILDIRIHYRYYNTYEIDVYKVINDPIYIENIYYINRFRECNNKEEFVNQLFEKNDSQIRFKYSQIS